MAPPVPRDKDDGLTVERPKAEFVRGRPERAVNPPPFGIGEAVDLIKAAAADNADDAAGHYPSIRLGGLIIFTTEIRRARGSKLSLRAKRSNLDPPVLKPIEIASSPCRLLAMTAQCTRDQTLRLAA